MNITTREMSKKQGLPASSDSQKLDDLLTKMDAFLEAKNDMLMKMNKLEEIQGTIVEDVDGLKQSLQASQQKIEEKADRTESAFLKRLIENLENRSKRNNIVIWSVEEGSERAYTSMKDFISVAIFQGLIAFERQVEVTRTNIKQNASDLIPVYLLRYTDKVFILNRQRASLKIRNTRIHSCSFQMTCRRPYV